MLSSVKSLNKIENLQKRARRFMLSDYESSHDELFRLSGNCAINVRLKKNLCVEIHKTLNDLNPVSCQRFLRPAKLKEYFYHLALRVQDFMDPRFGTLSHITLNRPKFIMF